MAQDDLARRVRDLKDALSSIETELKQGTQRPAGLEDLKAAVDSVRLSLWAILSSSQAEDYDAFIGAFRLRRATEIGRRLLGELENGSVKKSGPEFEEFKGTVEELASAIARR